MRRGLKLGPAARPARQGSPPQLSEASGSHAGQKLRSGMDCHGPKTIGPAQLILQPVRT
jgi:hypothetical protein